MGDLGGGTHQSPTAFGGSLRHDVSSDARRQSCSEGATEEEISRGCMTMVTAEVETASLDEIYEFLVNAEVVEGPPALRDIVAQLWPELLHKVKPPRSEMH